MGPNEQLSPTDATNRESASRKPPPAGMPNDFVPRESIGRLKRLLGHAQMPYWIAPVLLVVFLVPLVSTYFNGDISSTANEIATQLIRNCVVYCLLAVGSSVVVATGQIDLSGVGVAILSGMIFCLYLSYEVHPGFLTIFLAALLSLLFATFSGLAVAYCFRKLKAPLLILTWALGAIYTMVAILLTRLAGVNSTHDVSGVWLPITLPHDFWNTGHLGFNISVAAILIAITIPEWTSLGDRARAVGASENGARYAGVPTIQTYYEAFVMNAILSAAAGILASLYLNRASTADLTGRELIPIAIGVLGGTSLAGGYLKIPSIVSAAFFWTTVRLLGPQLPSIFPVLTAFQAEIGTLLFFSIFILVSLVFGKFLMPPLQKVFARQEV